MPQTREAAPPHPVQLAAAYGQTTVEPATATATAAATATCWLCGSEQPTSLMVPDGGAACADVRWYCRDAQRCTWRWTGARE